MKVCKRCKKQVANKAKLCKYCGSDVSTAKIIKTESVKKNSKEKIERMKTPDILIIQPQRKRNEKKKANIKDKFTKIAKTKVENKKPDKKEVEKNAEKIQKANIVIRKKREFAVIKKVFKAVDDFLNLEVFPDKQKVPRSDKIKVPKEKKERKKFRIIKKEKEVKIKEPKPKKEKQVIEKKEPVIKEVKKTKKTKIKLPKFNRRIRALIVLAFALILVGLAIFGIIKIYRSFTNYNNTVDVKDSSKKVFNINEKITYKKTDYIIKKIETSMGTEYRKPKVGNQFLVIYLVIENKSKEKINYSYANWVMTNSLGEYKNRIFTPINVDTAFYNGSLVVGAKKSGSLVFEQPIGDSNLKLNFFDILEEKEGVEQIPIEERDPVFSVIIKVP